MFVLKISLNNDLRRVSLPEMPPHEVLTVMIKNMFSIQDGFTLQYVDEDGDKITVKTNAELEEALRVSSKPNFLRLYCNGVVEDESEMVETDISTPELRGKSTNAPVIESISSKDKLESMSSRPSAANPEEDLDVLNQMQTQLQKLMSSLQGLVHSYHIPEHVNNFVTSADAQLAPYYSSEGVQKAFEAVDKTINSATNTVNDKVATARQFVEVNQQNISVADQIEYLKKEIARLTNSLRGLILAASANVALPTIPTGYPVAHPRVPSDASVVAESFEMVKQEEDQQSEDSTAPSEEGLSDNAGASDLDQLANMGFTDTEKNIGLLLKHKGDLVRVVEELLKAEA